MRSLPFITPGGVVFPRSDNDPLSGADLAIDDATDYSIFAILCGDSADSIGATTKDVFNEAVRVSQVVSHKFGSVLNRGFSATVQSCS